MNTKTLIGELQAIIDLLDPWEDSSFPLPMEAVPDVMQAWERLYGLEGHDISWVDRQAPLHQRMPKVFGWCVVKIEHDMPPDRVHPWPGMAFTSESKAERWREFLADYYDVAPWSRKYHWEVRFMPAEPHDFHRHLHNEIGRGYYESERRPWTGYTMRRFSYDSSKRKWVRHKELKTREVDERVCV